MIWRTALRKVAHDRGDLNRALSAVRSWGLEEQVRSKQRKCWIKYLLDEAKEMNRSSSPLMPFHPETSLNLILQVG